MKTILLKLYGPLQSWGTDSFFEIRRTDLYPSKSAIIGIICACYGYRREDFFDLEKFNSLKISVRIDQQGNLNRDYHIATYFKTTNGKDKAITNVTNRYYLEDAIFVISISHEDDRFINEIFSRLKNPYFQPYMGRKSCPVPGDFIIGMTNKDGIESLKNYPWLARPRYKYIHSNKLDCYTDYYVENNSFYNYRRDKAISFSQKERKHQYRNEFHLIIEAKDLENLSKKEFMCPEHDAYSAIEE